MSETPGVPQVTGKMFLYERPELMNKEQHGALGFKPVERRFAFCSKVRAIPLTLSEIPAAMKDYPIIFASRDNLTPLAVVGVIDEFNLFVDEAGNWEENRYIPGYVRRYPFVFMSGPDQKQFALCIDSASAFIVDGDGNPFFRDGQPTELTKNALAFCASFQAEYEKTRAFAAALAEHKLLESRTANIDLGDGQKVMFGPFRAIDVAKLAALPNAVIADWLRSGWLGWIYAHLMSAANWAALANRLKAPA